MSVLEWITKFTATNSTHRINKNVQFLLKTKSYDEEKLE